MKLVQAKEISYDYAHKRKYKDIRYIVVHNTANRGDSALGNCNYFAKYNTGKAGAHIFGDQRGHFIRSIRMNRTAWAVGGFYTNKKGAAKYYGKCTNYNSISIELCDIVDKKPSQAMLINLKKTIKYIQRWCPNATTIIRHWDVNGKDCPHIMTGTKNKTWKQILKYLGYQKGKKIK
jgi:N-acetylmuramoyl-L-alanine amidase CwlA